MPPSHLYVSSPVNALVQGILREDKTLSHILERGDFGLGTFNDLDGEMVVLDGVFYQLRSDGPSEMISQSALLSQSEMISQCELIYQSALMS